MTAMPTTPASPGCAGQRPQLAVGARGWEHDGWMASFYPDDLPSSWRLAYYANEFSCVLVPAEQWQCSDPADVAGWAADVPERFLFFVEVEAAAGERPRNAALAWNRRLDPLRRRLGGMLLRIEEACLDSAAPQTLITALAAEQPVWVEPPRSGTLPGWVEASGAQWSWVGQERLAGQSVLGLANDPGDVVLRELRRLIQGLLDAAPQAEQAFLMFAGNPPCIESLRHAVTIAHLLGA